MAQSKDEVKRALEAMGDDVEALTLLTTLIELLARRRMEKSTRAA
jgi:hypothetical protein